MSWRPAGPWHRVIAGALAAAVTISMLGLLLGRPASRPLSNTRAVLVRLLVPVPVPVPARAMVNGRRARHTPSAVPTPRASVPAPPEAARAAPEVIQAATPATLPTTPQAAPKVEPAGPAASAPLRLDEATVHAAIAQSKGLVQRPAAADSPAARLSAGIASAGKNDCLAPNQGGSILLLPLMAYAAATGQCK